MEYHFVSVEEFEKMVAEDKFVEHARFGRNYYGTSVKAIEDVEGEESGEGKRTCVLDIEMEVSLSTIHPPARDMRGMGEAALR